MRWTSEAESAVKIIPFFIRKKVRARVEKEAAAKGKDTVTVAEVNVTKTNFLAKMESEIKGYQLDTCFGLNGCPNQANSSEKLFEKIEAILQKANLLTFMRKTVKGELKLHHEFRVTISDCPNACSQPQIKDIGILGVCMPEITKAECSMCGGCVDVCKDEAIALDSENVTPAIDFDLCLKCGMCAKECPTGTINEGQKGFKVLLGGKLGRHPRLAKELPGIFSEEQVVGIIKACIVFYKKKSKNGKRFAEIFTGPDFLKGKARGSSALRSFF